MSTQQVSSHRWLSWTPVIVFMVAIIVVHAWQPQFRAESAPVVSVLYTLFLAGPALMVVFLAGQTFLEKGPLRMLMLGLGALFFGVIYIVSALLLPDYNAGVTVNNFGFMLSGVFFLLSGLLTGRPDYGPARGRRIVLSAAYLAAAAATTAWIWAAYNGLLPTFYTADGSYTFLRYFILGLGIAAFAASSIWYLLVYRRTGSRFDQLLSQSLAIITIAMIGALLIPAGGTVIAWVVRAALCVGGTYIFLAILNAIQESGSWRIPLERALIEKETQYLALLDSFSDSFLAMDSQWRITYINQRALGYGGKTATEVIGKTIWESFPTILGTPLEAFYREAMETQQPRTYVNRSVVATDMYFELHAYPAQGGLTVLGQDITERKKAEDAIRKSEEKYRNLFTNMTEGFALCDIIVDSNGKPVDYRVLEANLAWERLTGIAAAEIIGKPIREIIPNLEQDWVDNYGKVALTGEPVHVENYNQFTNSWYGIYAYSPQKGYFVSLVSNITERKKADEAIKKSEEKYRSLYENMLDGFVIAGMNGSIKEYNNAYKEMLGYSDEELKSLTYSDITPEKWHDFEARVVAEEIIKKGYSGIYEKEYRKKDGTIFPIELRTHLIKDESGQPSGMWAVVRDITERKKTEESLKDSEQRWATTLASIGDAVIATDAAGKLTFMNAQAEVMTGWALKEANGKPVSDVFNIINEQTREPVESPIPRIIRDGVVVGLANHTILVKKDGSETPIDDSGAPIMDEQGKTNGVVLVFRDVTERRKIDKVKDEFIGLVSHELRTPLTIVTGAVRTAMLEGLPPEDLRALLQEAALGAESLANILDNLLELSRSQANRLQLNLEPTNAKQVITRVVAQLISKSAIHHLTVDVPEQMPLVQVDKVRLERILYNLVDNAIKYSPKGGEVRIFAQLDDNSLVFGVSDQGIGISPEGQAQLFQPFQRLEQQAQTGIKGLGLGLIVCQRLVEAHHGSIWVESKQGKGTTFYFSIPVHGQETTEN